MAVRIYCRSCRERDEWLSPKHHLALAGSGVKRHYVASDDDLRSLMLVSSEIAYHYPTTRANLFHDAGLLAVVHRIDHAGRPARPRMMVAAPTAFSTRPRPQRLWPTRIMLKRNAINRFNGAFAEAYASTMRPGRRVIQAISGAVHSQKLAHIDQSAGPR